MTIYKPSLLDKFKDFVNGLKSNWDEYEDHVADFDAHLVDYETHLVENVSQVKVASRTAGLVGEQIISGFERKPKSLHITAFLDFENSFSIGYVATDNTQRAAAKLGVDNFISTGSYAIAIGRNQNGIFRGLVTINNDNTITVTWSVAGSVGEGSVQLRILAHYHGED